MAKEVWFSNYFDAYDEEEIRNDIFDDEYSRELYGWETPADIDDEIVWDKINIYQEEDFEAFKYDFGKYIDSTPYGLVLSGTAGCMFIYNINDLLSFLKDYDYIKVYSENGKLYIQGTYQDETDFSELRELTRLGSEFIDNHYYDYDDNKLINLIFANNKCSRDLMFNGF